MNRLAVATVGSVTLAVALGIVVLGRGNDAKERATRPHAAPSPLARADAAYSSKPLEARQEYEGFVAKNAKSPDPKVQDHVGAARMRLGYLAAKAHDLPTARAAFLQAARTKGTGAAGEFGTVSDQAAYQAVVCLVAEGKRKEAEKGFERLLKDRPLSPLARAAYGRLKRLNGGETRPEWDALMQSAVARQEARVRFETSVCGPKCLARVTGADYKVLAKLCGTTDSGTTVEGMRKGLKSLGRESWAARLNRQDIALAKLPAILFEGDHYVVLEKLGGDVATVWDPRFNAAKPWKLPPLDDPDFTATVILLSKPEGL